jgi:hypothetical protein
VEADVEANPIVAEPEPDLEAVADVTEPDAVTESIEELGESPQEEALAAGPGDAPVEGEDETLATGGPPVERVEDDPYGGIPIEVAPSDDREADRGQ